MKKLEDIQNKWRNMLIIGEIWFFAVHTKLVSNKDILAYSKILRDNEIIVSQKKNRKTSSQIKYNSNDNDFNFYNAQKKRNLYTSNED